MPSPLTHQMDGWREGFGNYQSVVMYLASAEVVGHEVDFFSVFRAPRNIERTTSTEIGDILGIILETSFLGWHKLSNLFWKLVSLNIISHRGFLRKKTTRI